MFISTVLPAFDSVTIRFVLPCPTGEIVIISPSILACAIFSSGSPVIVNAPQFVPVIVTCPSAPPTYSSTFVGFAIIFTLSTVSIAS